MVRRTLFATAAIALGAAVAATATALAQGTPATTQAGERMQTNLALGERKVRMVMIGDDGNTVDIVYGMEPGPTQSQRVLRLENVNGMLTVIYDGTVPGMALGTGGTPRLVQQGGGMYEVVYDRR